MRDWTEAGALMLPSTLSILTNTFPDPRERFVAGLRTGLMTWLIGAAAQHPA